MSSTGDSADPGAPAPKRRKEESCHTDRDRFSDNDDETEDEEWQRQYWIFLAEAMKSQGFDIDFSQFDREFDIRPLEWEESIFDSSEGTDGYIVNRCTEFALQQYNKDKGTNLKIVRIEKANWARTMFYTFWVTFSVRDRSSSDGEEKIYQAKVRYFFEIEVFFCRPKPTEEEMASLRALPPHCYDPEVLKTMRGFNIEFY